MDKDIKLAILTLLGFLSFLWLKKPLREYLSQSLFEEQTAALISAITIRIFLIIVAFVLIKKLQHINFTGLKSWKKFKNPQAVIIASALIVMGIIGNWSTYTDAKYELLILFLFSTLIVGIVEELFFRGLVFPLFIKSLKSIGRPVLIGAVASSLMFGLVHFVNLFSQPGNIVGITSQVFFATSIGVFFCGLLVITENILIPCIIHALVNFSYGADVLKESIEETPVAEVMSEINWSSIIPTTIFFSFILIGGIYMILMADKERTMNTLNI